MAITNYRQQLRDAVHDLLVAYKAANAGQLAHVYNHPPQNPRVPCAYVTTEIPEPSITFDAQLRLRQLVVGVVVLLRATNAKEFSEAKDVLAEGLIDYFTVNNRQLPEAQMVPDSLDDPVEESFGDATYVGFRLNIRGSIQQGRAI